MLTFSCTLLFFVCCQAAILDKSYWEKVSQEELSDALKRSEKLNLNVAKNLILFIGDGMGITTTTAARVLKGQRTPGMFGEEAFLSWDKFPYIGLSKTYATDLTTTDSAASATAYHSGVKTKTGAIGVDDNIIPDDCSTVEKAKVRSVLDWALAQGKSVGIISTDGVIEASPAATFAHSPNRKWRKDDDLPKDAKGKCKDIARQLVEDNLDIQVVLGGGRKYFLPKTAKDPEYLNKKGSREDGLNLMNIWLDNQLKKKRSAKVVFHRAQFDNIDPATTDYVLGLFEREEMQEEAVRRLNNTEPSLAELTEKAIQILSKNPKGFYLFVEEERVDIAHHENRAKAALEATLELDRAVAKALERTSTQDTLVVVTADHSHVFTFGGYSVRGHSILSLAKSSDKFDKDELGEYYTVLSYGNGPGYSKAPRKNLKDEMFRDDQIYVASVPLEKETHGGEDVAVYASGPMAHLFAGVHEETFIAHAMLYAGCLGNNTNHCTLNKDIIG